MGRFSLAFSPFTAALVLIGALADACAAEPAPARLERADSRPMCLRRLALGDYGSKYMRLGDLNGDGVVDLRDYYLLISHFLQTGKGVVGDINNDGVVDLKDYFILVGAFHF